MTPKSYCLKYDIATLLLEFNFSLFSRNFSLKIFLHYILIMLFPLLKFLPDPLHLPFHLSPSFQGDSYSWPISVAEMSRHYFCKLGLVALSGILVTFFRCPCWCYKNKQGPLMDTLIYERTNSVIALDTYQVPCCFLVYFPKPKGSTLLLFSLLQTVTYHHSSQSDE